MHVEMYIKALRAGFICVLMLTALSLYAQKYPVEGKIQDKITFMPLSNVNISFTGSRMGCITDAEGLFSIDLDTLPVNMIISHVGYKTMRIWLTKPAGPFNILLEPSVTMLSEVEITGKNEPRIFFKDEKYAVLDYEIDNNLVYLLIFRFHIARSSLLCLTLAGDTIATSSVLPFKPIELFHDCLGYIHVLSQDSAYQVYFNSDTLELFYASDIKKFNETVLRCAASTDERMFFREESWDKLTVRFFHVHRQTKQMAYMASSSDKEKLKILYKNPMDLYLFMSDTLPCSIGDIVEYVYIRKILYKPNASVMHRIGDTLCVFNTIDGSLELYDLEGRYISRQLMPLAEIGESSWTKEIYIDPVAKRSYTSSLKNGTLTLYRIDITSGSLSRVLSTSHAFPENLKVYNDHLYYLYDVPGEGDNKHLFKQKL
jgi:hypothetical protein